jgi:hypothetical protein
MNLSAKPSEILRYSSPKITSTGIGIYCALFSKYVLYLIYWAATCDSDVVSVA